jgi:hypothetical protein
VRNPRHSATVQIRWFRAAQWIRTTKLAQLIEPVGARFAALDRTPAIVLDMDHFRSRRVGTDDPRRAAARSNFLASLEDIADRVRDAGVKMMVSTVAVNLQDCRLSARFIVPTFLPPGIMNGKDICGGRERRQRFGRARLGEIP